jgi:hypothetical protein
MKPTNLDRLLRSASNLPQPASSETPPLGFDTRVVASWRSGRGGMNDVADVSRFLRRAGVIACAVMVLAGAAAYGQYRDETNFAAPTNEYAIADSAIQTEFSQ